MARTRIIIADDESIHSHGLERNVDFARLSCRR